MSGEARLLLTVPPPPALAARLQELQAALPGGAWDLALSGPEDLQLTLHVLGPTPLKLVDDLKRDLGALCHARRRFDLDCGGLRCHPDEVAPRVLSIGLRDPAGKLRELFEASRRVLNGYRLFKLGDDLAPHLPLARVTRLGAAWDPAPLRGLARDWQRLGPYPVERLWLVLSDTGRRGGQSYECLVEMALQAK